MIRNIGTSLFHFIVVICLAVGLSVSAYAAEGATGSIFVSLLDSESREPVPGGTVYLYQVAQQVDGLLVRTAAFEDFDGRLGNLNAPGLAQELYAHVKGQPPYLEVTADYRGQVLFPQQPEGLYLVAQPADKVAEGYYPIDPFLVTIPMWDEAKGEWDYSVDASPKAETIPVVTPTPPPDTPPKPPLIQTGQLNWPVPVLAGLGLALFAYGWVLSRKGEADES